MSQAQFDFAGKTVLVTGGTSGLGRAVALAFAQSGAVVYAGSRDAGKVSEAETALKAISPDSKAVSLDVADPESVRSVVETIVAERGSLDYVVNAAGVTKRAPAEEMSLEDWDYVMRINLTGTFLVSQAAARAMIATGHGGAIVNIASLASYLGWSLVAAYGASKAAVVELTETLAIEWAKYNIRVNAIAPGVFPTPLNRALITGTPRGEWFKNHTPMGRFGEPEELTGAALFLCSDAASYVTGHTLAVDGGYLACGVPVDPPSYQ